MDANKLNEIYIADHNLAAEMFEGFLKEVYDYFNDYVEPMILAPGCKIKMIDVYGVDKEFDTCSNVYCLNNIITREVWQITDSKNISIQPLNDWELYDKIHECNSCLQPINNIIHSTSTSIQNIIDTFDPDFSLYGNRLLEIKATLRDFKFMNPRTQFGVDIFYDACLLIEKLYNYIEDEKSNSRKNNP